MSHSVTKSGEGGPSFSCRIPSAISFIAVAYLLCSGLSDAAGATIAYTVDADAILDMPFDEFWVDRLEEQGHTVVAVGAGDDPDDTPDVELFIISNDVNSGELNPVLFEEPRPIIVFEDALYDEFAISVPGGRQDDVEIEIDDPSHPLAAGLSGTVEIYADLHGITHIGDPWAPGLHVIASVFDFPTIAVLEPDAEDMNGDAAPGLRITMFAFDASLGDDYTDAGLALLDAAVNYSLGGQAGVSGDFNGDGILAADDVNALIGEINGTQDPAFDLTDDGAVGQDDLSAWVKDLRNTWIGDANLDGEFNSGDLVAVFTAGKFELDEDAGWDQGDWDGDGRFTSGDFVAAFADGGYEVGPRAAVQSVPEPTGIAGLALAMLIAMLRRRIDLHM